MSNPNPPLPYTRDAIIGHLQQHATNGPAYVQIQATTALARIMGLFSEAKEAVANTAHRFSDESRALYKRAGQLMRGEVEPRPDDLHGGAPPGPADRTRPGRTSRRRTDPRKGRRR